MTIAQGMADLTNIACRVMRTDKIKINGRLYVLSSIEDLRDLVTYIDEVLEHINGPVTNSDCLEDYITLPDVNYVEQNFLKYINVINNVPGTLPENDIVESISVFRFIYKYMFVVSYPSVIDRYIQLLKQHCFPRMEINFTSSESIRKLLRLAGLPVTSYNDHISILSETKTSLLQYQQLKVDLQEQLGRLTRNIKLAMQARKKSETQVTQRNNIEQAILTYVAEVYFKGSQRVELPYVLNPTHTNKNITSRSINEFHVVFICTYFKIQDDKPILMEEYKDSEFFHIVLLILTRCHNLRQQQGFFQRRAVTHFFSSTTTCQYGRIGEKLIAVINANLTKLGLSSPLEEGVICSNLYAIGSYFSRHLNGYVVPHHDLIKLVRGQEFAITARQPVAQRDEDLCRQINGHMDTIDHYYTKLGSMMVTALDRSLIAQDPHETRSSSFALSDKKNPLRVRFTIQLTNNINNDTINIINAIRANQENIKQMLLLRRLLASTYIAEEHSSSSYVTFRGEAMKRCRHTWTQLEVLISCNILMKMIKDNSTVDSIMMLSNEHKFILVTRRIIFGKLHGLQQNKTYINCIEAYKKGLRGNVISALQKKSNETLKSLMETNKACGAKTSILLG